MDITRFINWFIDQIVSLVSYFFSLLTLIEFNGTSLLSFIISLIVIGLVLDLLVISARTRRVKNTSHSKQAEKGEKNDSK